jgi:hypothetical protein
LRSTMIFGCFVGRKPSMLEFEAWLVLLNKELGRDRACFSHFEGRGFFSLEADSKNTQKWLLTLPPQHSQKGMYVLQPWVPNFRLQGRKSAQAPPLGKGET